MKRLIIILNRHRENSGDLRTYNFIHRAFVHEFMKFAYTIGCTNVKFKKPRPHRIKGKFVYMNDEWSITVPDIRFSDTITLIFSNGHPDQKEHFISYKSEKTFIKEFKKAILT